MYVLPLNGNEVVAFVAALLVEEADGVHELVNNGALLCHAAGDLEVHVLGPADAADAAPAAGVARGDAYVIRLLAGVGLELDARVTVVVAHRLTD